MNKKLTLEDLKLESFLTEIDNSKLVKVQGGNGAYAGGYSEDGDCETGENAGCDTPGGSDYCDTEDAGCNTCNCTDGCTDDCTDGDACPSLQSNDCDGGSGEVQC